jgi:mannose-6-phosphate isomerase class I
MVYGNYDLNPHKNIKGYDGCAFEGYDSIVKELKNKTGQHEKFVIVIETYTQVRTEEILKGLRALRPKKIFNAEKCTLSDSKYNQLIKDYVTEDRVFGVMNTLRLENVYVQEKIEKMRAEIESAQGLVIVYGVGASIVARGDILIYCDLARWEIQRRFAAGFANWKTNNASGDKLRKFKQGFFVEWRMADRLKRTLLDEMDYFLDTNKKDNPKMITGDAFRAGLVQFSQEPFRLVPYFAPEVWGGQWMKKVCGLDSKEVNYAWAFDGVPEENSIYMNFNGIIVEVPSVDVVFYRPVSLLGDRVHARFGDEFPIRFDFLDTIEGQNLSLQVHPLTEYIQHTFGMHYTQDESYYILDCKDEGYVYLGLKNGADKDAMLRELRQASKGEIIFDAEKYVNKIRVKKHDHILIPAGTIHCSAKDTMVLEISATPYIFTFKLWDWSRVGLDGIPRPTHINHGEKVIQWHRNTDWVHKNLINRFEIVKESEGYKEEITGLHEREFILTRRYTLSEPAVIETDDSVSVCNLVSGKEALIESVDGAFGPLEVHYAETFIIPAYIKKFKITPADKEVMIIRATIKK